MCEQPKEDRRREERTNCFRFVCSCMLKPDPAPDKPNGGKRCGAVLVNISRQGICLETNFKPAKGECLHFEIRPIVGPEIAATIRVLHARPSLTHGFYMIGTEFAELGEEDSRNLLILLDTVSRLEEDLAQR